MTSKPTPDQPTIPARIAERSTHPRPTASRPATPGRPAERPTTPQSAATPPATPGRTAEPPTSRPIPAGLPHLLVALAVLCGLLALLALLACRPAAASVANGKDPFAALAAPVESEIWDLAFWVREQAAGTALWRRSFAFCRARAESAYPNCLTVRLASWWGSPPPLPPPPPPLADLLRPPSRRAAPPDGQAAASTSSPPAASRPGARPAGARR